MVAESEPLDLLVKGTLILRDRIVPHGVLGVRSERIATIASSAAGLEAHTTLDVGDRYVLPGLVDTHVHTLSSREEGIARATSAAAAGGVTTIVDMPYDAGSPVFDAQRLHAKAEAVAAEAYVDVGLYGSMAKSHGIKEVPALLDSGVLAFKFSLFETDPDRFPRILDGDFEAALLLLAAAQVPIVVHAELQEVIERRLAESKAQGDEGADAHGRSRPVVSETAAIAKALEFALWTGARVHIAHITHPHGFRLIDWYRRQGASVSGETCVQYLALSEDDVLEQGPIAKVNPPIRDNESRNSLWSALAEGQIASISTDHAPWPIALKRRPMLLAASGMPGLETFLPVLHTEATRRAFPLTDLVEAVAGRPADIFGLGGRKGRLEVGYDADFVIFAPSEEWTFDPSRSWSSARWSPFAGRELRGRVEASYVRGRPVYKDGEMQQGPGYGRWLRAKRDAQVDPWRAA